VNLYAVKAIYGFEMARTGRTLFQSIVSPVISTSLYFIVFGAAIGSRITEIDGISYGSFIVPGLIMLSLLTESISNASFGIYFPRFSGTIYELLSAPVSYLEVVLGYVGAAASKSVILGAIILITANLFVDVNVAHPFPDPGDQSGAEAEPGSATGDVGGRAADILVEARHILEAAADLGTVEIDRRAADGDDIETRHPPMLLRLEARSNRRILPWRSSRVFIPLRKPQARLSRSRGATVSRLRSPLTPGVARFAWGKKAVARAPGHRVL
jgi:hypothetical protein